MTRHATTVHQKVQDIRNALKGVLFERSNVIDGALVAMLAGEHVYLLGPPGTAKSALASQLCEALDGASYFQRLMTKFTVPEEIFGPVSLKGLENDEFRRVVAGKLPTAHVAFIDEIFKANSSILNAMLKVINERQFENNGTILDCPLVTMFSASNELPESKDLEALFDRFLMRFWVDSIQDRSNLTRMFRADDPKITTKITLAELEQARKEAQAVDFPDDVLEIMIDVKIATERAGVRASDRRWKRAINALKALAYLEGQPAVTQDHFDLLTDMLWRDPRERSALAKEIAKVANPWIAKCVEIQDAAKEMMQSMPASDVGRAKQLAALAEANAQFEGMETALANIKQQVGAHRKIEAAMGQIKAWHEDCQRLAAKVAGIRL